VTPRPDPTGQPRISWSTPKRGRNPPFRLAPDLIVPLACYYGVSVVKTSGPTNRLKIIGQSGATLDDHTQRRACRGHSGPLGTTEPTANQADTHAFKQYTS